MATSSKKRKFPLPRDAEATGPQNNAEKCVYDLVMEGVNSGPSKPTTVAALSSSLRARIRSRRG